MDTEIQVSEVTACYSEGLGLITNNLIDMNIFPNPTASELSIYTDELVSSISIFNLSGALVQQETTKSFSVINLSSGIYIVNVATQNGLRTLHLVKE